MMETWVWGVIAIAVLVLVGLAAWAYLGRRRSGQLQERFGPEYERTEAEHGDRRRAEAELQAREKRRQQLDIRPLSPDERTRFSESWRSVQARFVDDPQGAITDADLLVNQVMEARGYPVGDFDQRAADVSVDHPGVVQNYRAARDIAVRNRNAQAGTEDLRQGMIHYRALFDELLSDGQAPDERGMDHRTT